MKESIDARLERTQCASESPPARILDPVRQRARRKSIVKLIDELSPRHRHWQVFTDFVTMTACALSNVVDRVHFDVREAMYMECVRRYTKEELENFPKMLAELTLAFEEGPRDVLGEIFMELELGNDRAGQFFTPMSVCELMARIQIDERLEKEIEHKGFVTLNDPACGAGAMLIAFGNALAERGLNYQQHVHITATDIDQTAAMMCYVQLSLMHIPAVIVNGNSLTLEERSHWSTAAHILGGWSYRLRRAGAPPVADEQDPDVEEQQQAPASSC